MLTDQRIRIGPEFWRISKAGEAMGPRFRISEKRFHFAAQSLIAGCIVREKRRC
jgi:hypothetical protein